MGGNSYLETRERRPGKEEPKDYRCKLSSCCYTRFPKLCCEIFQTITRVEPVVHWPFSHISQMGQYQDFATLAVIHSTLPPLFSFLKLLKADPRHHTFPFHTSMCLPRNYGHFSYITAMLLSHLEKVKLFCVSFNMQPIFTFLCLKNVYSWFI